MQAGRRCPRTNSWENWGGTNLGGEVSGRRLKWHNPHAWYGGGGRGLWLGPVRVAEELCLNGESVDRKSLLASTWCPSGCEASIEHPSLPGGSSEAVPHHTFPALASGLRPQPPSLPRLLTILSPHAPARLLPASENFPIPALLSRCLGKQNHGTYPPLS